MQNYRSSILIKQLASGCSCCMNGRNLVFHLLKDRGLLILLIIFSLDQLLLLLKYAHSLFDELGTVKSSDRVKYCSLSVSRCIDLLV